MVLSWTDLNNAPVKKNTRPRLIKPSKQHKSFSPTAMILLTSENSKMYKILAERKTCCWSRSALEKKISAACISQSSSKLPNGTCTNKFEKLIYLLLTNRLTEKYCWYGNKVNTWAYLEREILSLNHWGDAAQRCIPIFAATCCHPRTCMKQ